MKKDIFDFYSDTNIKSYNLNESMRYQLSMLDNLDVYTRKHCENVANLTCRICEYLHCKKEFIIYCTICAYLHDIGKLFIPPSILQKNGPLTDEEYEIMKTHTTIGYDMCIKDPELKLFANGALYHHEALNGSGYPNGKTKKDIPYEGKIIRVADEFDAIVSKRQYKSHVGISDTLKMLIEETKYIPKAVALKTMEDNSKLGKISARIVHALCKVVIDDTEYEITCAMDYIKYLKFQIKRLEKIQKYNMKMQKAKKETKKGYYEELIKAEFEGGETFGNFIYILEEYRTAVFKKQEIIDNLFTEIKEIKKLKV